MSSTIVNQKLEVFASLEDSQVANKLSEKPNAMIIPHDTDKLYFNGRVIRGVSEWADNYLKKQADAEVSSKFATGATYSHFITPGTTQNTYVNNAVYELGAQHRTATGSDQNIVTHNYKKVTITLNCKYNNVLTNTSTSPVVYFTNIASGASIYLLGGNGSEMNGSLSAVTAGQNYPCNSTSTGVYTLSFYIPQEVFNATVAAGNVVTVNWKVNHIQDGVSIEKTGSQIISRQLPQFMFSSASTPEDMVAAITSVNSIYAAPVPTTYSTGRKLTNPTGNFSVAANKYGYILSTTTKTIKNTAGQTIDIAPETVSITFKDGNAKNYYLYSINNSVVNTTTTFVIS